MAASEKNEPFYVTRYLLDLAQAFNKYYYEYRIIDDNAAQTKARAVHDTVYGEITTACPASILRTKTGAKLYLDPDSGALL